MDIATLKTCLDDSQAADAWLRGIGVLQGRRGHRSLVEMATAGVTLDLLEVIATQLETHLPDCPDPDMALGNLARFITAARNPLALGTLFERDAEAMPVLVRIFSTSQHLSDLLIRDPGGFDLLRLTEGKPAARQALVDELVAEIDAMEHDEMVLRALRRFKRRELLRIAYGDIIGEQSLRVVTQQISFLAEALLEAAVRAAGRKVGQRRGTPMTPEGRPCRFTILGMGKLGGQELNYSSDIDLIFLHEADGQTDGRRPISNAEFFEAMSKEIVHLMADSTELGIAWRVDLRLRPEGARSKMCPSVGRALSYYDLRGRTWERQAYIKARPVAGSLELGREFLDQLEPWIYRRYLGRVDIGGIKALKRRIERRARESGGATLNVKTGRGGIRDVEFVIQFLQLLNGGDLPELRVNNTLDALAQLEACGCLNNQERTMLSENYRFLRRIEHRLQIMFDLQTHLMPDDADERRKLALRMGYRDTPSAGALDAFVREYDAKTALNRKILDHLLHDAFSDDVDTADEIDLILDPEPPEDHIEAALGRHGFADVKQAYRHLMALSEERIRFLSTRRCRHFLAAIAPRLLRAIAATPDPDSTLVNLDKVSDSLGGKGVLWELFSFNEPSLKLYVELCAYSPHLCSILTSNPGMIDGLMDSLVLDKLPQPQFLRDTLADLSRGAEDLDPILHAFKNDQQLRVGVREILGKEGVEQTTAALSQIAEVCLAQIVAREFELLTRKLGTPRVAEGRRRGKSCEPIMLAMGKFGGQEMNYFSDLDIVLLFEADGHVEMPGGRGQGTTNQHFFSELGARIIKSAGRMSTYGRLYEIDARLRPTGKSGSLAVSLDEFKRYFAEGQGQLWERQALCKARVVHGSPRMAKQARKAVAGAAFHHRWRRKDADEIRRMRNRLEGTAVGGDLKRGPGGIVDVEFLVQMLQLKHARKNPDVCSANTLDALARLHRTELIDERDHRILDRCYRLLRAIEGRLCLMNAPSRNQLPDDPTERDKLAHLLAYESVDALHCDFAECTRLIRERFDAHFDAAGPRRT
jgi:glutamate-ammonia-ligase adenylyltransferase